jgi:hypothetical protein
MRAATSGFGTFRTSRDLCLESGMRSKADECAPDTLMIDVRDGAIFRNGFRLICPVQPGVQK